MGVLHLLEFPFAPTEPSMTVQSTVPDGSSIVPSFELLTYHGH